VTGSRRRGPRPLLSARAVRRDVPQDRWPWVRRLRRLGLGVRARRTNAYDSGDRNSDHPPPVAVFLRSPQAVVIGAVAPLGLSSGLSASHAPEHRTRRLASVGKPREPGRRSSLLLVEPADRPEDGEVAEGWCPPRWSGTAGSLRFARIARSTVSAGGWEPSAKAFFNRSVTLGFDD